MKKKSYDISSYADSVFTEPFEDTPEERIDVALRNTNVGHYRVKTIISGPIVESEIYPVYLKKSYAPPKPKSKVSTTAQRNLNDKNAKKKIVRLVNANFTSNDIWATFTYNEKHKPQTPQAAQRDIQLYIKRLRAYCKKNNLPELKYIYVTEFNFDDSPKGHIRIHHHIIMNFADRDVAESMWKLGGRKNTRRLQPDDFGLEGLARYMIKDPHSKKRWASSLNLEKPKIYYADKKFRSIHQVEEMLTVYGAERKIKKLYPNYTQLEPTQIYINEQYGGYYFYTRLRGETNDGYRKSRKSKTH